MKRRVYNRQHRNTKDHENIMSNYMLIKWTTYRKWTDNQNSSTSRD